MTPQEKELWYHFLSNYPVRFQRQKAIDRFIVDFYCAKALLVIEVDGNQHLSEHGKAYDEDRTQILRCKYIEVIRFSNNDIDRHFKHVCEQINEKVKSRLKKIPDTAHDTSEDTPPVAIATSPSKREI